ncbi:uncharacterized protein EKO05_0009617 [Ascochyta rabiei]|uniref:uncharacterized protein n=1 Tax=Didymella rabiei TaxID=5454 RepID=UPI00220C1B62|nr:uncharacterized protein EKO05_0009617 [Ascochyta rabiei]UPX19350.1 hypothetical protein EKO05_0009617 [Ascochyta rabiei]
MLTLRTTDQRAGLCSRAKAYVRKGGRSLTHPQPALQRDAHWVMADTSSLTRTKSNGQNAQPPRVRRRNRIISSCLECRRRKLKCDRGQPCTNCVKASRQCHFIAPGFDAAAQARLAEVKEKMGILEMSLEEDVAQRNRVQTDSSASLNKLSSTLSPVETYSEGEEEEGTEHLKTSQYSREDSVYYECEEGDDDIVDLGIAMGKVRITERIGGLVRPKFSDELSYKLRELPQSGPRGSDLSSSDAVDWMMPSIDYVAPSSSFFFTPGAERRTLMNYLPTRELVDKLMAHYWQAVHVIARAVHRPSFERHYEKFWKDIATGIEPRKSFQAVVFAALLSSVVSMSNLKVSTDFGVDKQGLVDSFREATEAALSRANLLRATKLETVQAFVMYLIPLCRAEVSRAHSALTGTCIRLAECMGLHKDPSTYSTSPVECQVRRLIWHQICFLDLRTCEATGPRPQIRPDDFDTHLPLNIDDVDLDRAEHGDKSVDVEKDRSHFTDMTITRMRFECYEMHRFLWVERPKLERKRKEGEKRVTINSLLARIQSFRASMEKTYLPMLNKTTPLHALASQMYGILSDRLYVHILQRYLSSDRHKMPESLRQIILSAAIMILEHSQTIEQEPALSTWSWYVGALHQYHTAVLILSELYAQPPTSAMEQRAWRVLDFVFELSPSLSPTVKTRAVLEDLVTKTQVYASMKRWRAPNDMPQAGSQTHAPGYQSRQQKAEELQSTAGASGQTSLGTASPQGIRTSPPIQPPRLPQTQSQSSGSGAIHFPGAMPNADWGTFDISLPASTSPFQPPLTNPDVYTTPYPPLAPSSTLMPSPHAVSQSSDPASLIGPSTAVAHGASNSSAGASPMAALNEVDWNEIEQLFGGAETGTGNMMIPPFAFPQFLATDLQWPQEGF